MTLLHKIETQITVALVCFSLFAWILFDLIKAWCKGKDGIGLTFMGYWFVSAILVGFVVLSAHIGTQIAVWIW